MSTKWLCPTPKQFCMGGNLTMSNSITRRTTKAHGSPGEAFACYKHYLVHELGYTQVGAREFSPPDGGPVTVLTKKSRFGARLRPGKLGRHMPHFSTSGTIISE